MESIARTDGEAMPVDIGGIKLLCDAGIPLDMPVRFDGNPRHRTLLHILLHLYLIYGYLLCVTNKRKLFS
jgi:hypothetical protein